MSNLQWTEFSLPQNLEHVEYFPGCKAYQKFWLFIYIPQISQKQISSSCGLAFPQGIKGKIKDFCPQITFPQSPSSGKLMSMQGPDVNAGSIGAFRTSFIHGTNMYEHLTSIRHWSTCLGYIWEKGKDLCPHRAFILDRNCFWNSASFNKNPCIFI